MKMTFIPIVILSLSIVACNNNKPKESVTITSEDGKEQITIDANQAGNAAVEMEKTKEELSKLTPLSAEELKALVPEQLMGATHSDLDVNTAMGASVASADYKINDSMDINLNIIDCAGPFSVGYGWDAWKAQAGLAQGEKDTLDRYWPALPQIIVTGCP